LARYHNVIFDSLLIVMYSAPSMERPEVVAQGNKLKRCIMCFAK